MKRRTWRTAPASTETYALLGNDSFLAAEWLSENAKQSTQSFTGKSIGVHSDTEDITSRFLNSTTGTESVYHADLPTDWVTYLSAGFGILIAFLGIFANSVTIAAYRRSRKLRTTFNFLIINLCTVDLVFSALIIPMHVAMMIAKGNVFGTTGCVVAAYLSRCSTSSSTANLVCIAVNRYVGVVHLRRYGRVFAGEFAKWWVVGIWTIVPLLYLPLAIGNSNNWSDSAFRCSLFAVGHDGIVLRSYKIFLSVFFKVLPVLALAFLYRAILQKVKKRRKAAEHHPLTNAAPSNSYMGQTGTRQSPAHPTSTPSAKTRERKAFGSASPEGMKETTFPADASGRTRVIVADNVQLQRTVIISPKTDVVLPQTRATVVQQDDGGGHRILVSGVTSSLNLPNNKKAYHNEAMATPLKYRQRSFSTGDKKIALELRTAGDKKNNLKQITRFWVSKPALKKSFTLHAAFPAVRPVDVNENRMKQEVHDARTVGSTLPSRGENNSSVIESMFSNSTRISRGALPVSLPVTSAMPQNKIAIPGLSKIKVDDEGILSDIERADSSLESCRQRVASVGSRAGLFKRTLRSGNWSVASLNPFAYRDSRPSMSPRGTVVKIVIDHVTEEQRDDDSCQWQISNAMTSDPKTVSDPTDDGTPTVHRSSITTGVEACSDSKQLVKVQGKILSHANSGGWFHLKFWKRFRRNSRSRPLSTVENNPPMPTLPELSCDFADAIRNTESAFRRQRDEGSVSNEKDHKLRYDVVLLPDSGAGYPLPGHSTTRCTFGHQNSSSMQPRPNLSSCGNNNPLGDSRTSDIPYIDTDSSEENGFISTSLAEPSRESYLLFPKEDAALLEKRSLMTASTQYLRVRHATSTQDSDNVMPNGDRYIADFGSIDLGRRRWSCQSDVSSVYGQRLAVSPQPRARSSSACSRALSRRQSGRSESRSCENRHRKWPSFASSRGSSSSRRRQGEKKLADSGIMICVAFAVIMLPSSAVDLLWHVMLTRLPAEAEFGVVALAWLRVVANPFLYGFLNSQFRSEYGKMMREFFTFRRRSGRLGLRLGSARICRKNTARQRITNLDRHDLS